MTAGNPPGIEEHGSEGRARDEDGDPNFGATGASRAWEAVRRYRVAEFLTLFAVTTVVLLIEESWAQHELYVPPVSPSPLGRSTSNTPTLRLFCDSNHDQVSHESSCNTTALVHLEPLTIKHHLHPVWLAPRPTTDSESFWRTSRIVGVVRRDASAVEGGRSHGSVEYLNTEQKDFAMIPTKPSSLSEKDTCQGGDHGMSSTVRVPSCEQLVPVDKQPGFEGEGSQEKGKYSFRLTGQ